MQPKKKRPTTLGYTQNAVTCSYVPREIVGLFFYAGKIEGSQVANIALSTGLVFIT